MKRKRYTEEQIISILKEHEAGAPSAGHVRFPQCVAAGFHRDIGSIEY